MEKRLQLFLMVALISFMFMTLMTQKNQPPPSDGTSVGGVGGPQTTVTGGGGTANGAAGAAGGVDVPAVKPYVEGPRISVRTDVYAVEFSTNGAVPESWDIIDPTYGVRVRREDLQGDEGDPIREEGGVLVLPEKLIDPELKNHRDLSRPLQTVLQVTNSRYFNEFNRDVFSCERLDGEGRPDAEGLTLRFTSPTNESGVRMVKTYAFDPESFRVGLSIRLTNDSESNLQFGGGERGLGLVLGPGLGGRNGSSRYEPIARYAAVDAVLKAENEFLYDHIDKLKRGAGGVTPGETITQERTVALSDIQWGGIVSKYFIGVIVPEEGTRFISAKALLDNDVLGTLIEEKKNVGEYPSIELYGEPFTLRAGETRDFNYRIYMGPKKRETLEAAGHDLTRAMFHNSFNWMRALCLALMTLLFWFHTVAGNWGVAIILLTVLVRVATLPFVHKMMKTQAKMTRQMGKLKPQIEKINEKYKDDPQRKQQETWKLYRENNVNPLGMLKGCGWMMLQLPIFIGLYSLLYQVIDLRGAPFLWITDLSQGDRLFSWGVTLPLVGSDFNLLPLIVAVTQMLTSKFMQTPATDPQQVQIQKMMTYLMPVMILVFTYRFPAGLMVYWLVSNLWQVVQQVYVNKVINKPEAAAA
jgi:YidC/Oxa1 family membrane protein insertase